MKKNQDTKGKTTNNGVIVSICTYAIANNCFTLVYFLYLKAFLTPLPQHGCLMLKDQTSKITGNHQHNHLGKLGHFSSIHAKYFLVSAYQREGFMHFFCHI